MPQPTVYGIFGHPVAHSRSPQMHNAAFAACGLHATYVGFDVSPEALADAVAGARAMGIAGLNITLPHKTAIMPLVDEVDDLATAIGAVNTVIREGGRLLGTNTDGDGLARALAEASVELEGARVVILGAGGAVRGAAVGLARAGAAHITVAARRFEAAEELVRDLRSVEDVQLDTCAMDSLEDRFADCDVLVQGTSATLARSETGSSETASAFAQSLPIAALPEHAVVTDMVYTPRITTVLARAQSRSLRVVDGSGMLIHQGALAFERWTGRTAPIEVMREAFWQEPVRNGRR